MPPKTRAERRQYKDRRHAMLARKSRNDASLERQRLMRHIEKRGRWQNEGPDPTQLIRLSFVVLALVIAAAVLVVLWLGFVRGVGLVR